MNAKPVILIAVAVVAVTGAVISFQQRMPDAASANLFPYTDHEAVRRGAALYVENCASCHGDNLQGQDNWRAPAANGRAAAPPHDETGHTWHHPDIQLFQIVKFGTAALVGNGYESDMVGYEGLLSDAEILDILAYIKSTWPDDIIERHNAMNAAAGTQ